MPTRRFTADNRVPKLLPFSTSNGSQHLHWLSIHLENQLSSDTILVLLIYMNYLIRLILQKLFLPGLSGVVSVSLTHLDFNPISPCHHF